MNRLIFIAVNASDLERSAAFYRDAFGVDLHRDTNEPAHDVWIGGEHAAYSFTNSFLHFALFPALEPERPVTRDAQLGFSVEAISEAHTRAVSAGASVVHGPREEPWGTEIPTATL